MPYLHGTPPRSEEPPDSDMGDDALENNHIRGQGKILPDQTGERHKKATALAKSIYFINYHIDRIKPNSDPDTRDDIEAFKADLIDFHLDKFLTALTIS